MFKNALISCSDKKGLAEFLKKFPNLRIVSTGGTAAYLRKNHIPVVEVSEQTGFPEVMDGRVRTLHPNIHMALLAREENSHDMEVLKKHDLEKFDLVIGNLYPFEEQSKSKMSDRELSEFIDIGGVALLRAAAKNYQQITVICDSDDYDWVGDEAEVSLEKRKYLAGKVFAHISSYDSLIAKKLLGFPLQQKEISFGAKLVQPLRYGENPHQDANWLKLVGEEFGIHNAKVLSGKPLSYNNILDIDAAAILGKEFTEAVCVAVKHNNPCGVGADQDAKIAVKKCLEADPISVFGGIVVCNRPIDMGEADLLCPIFLECIVAPEFSPKAFQKLSQKKNLRLLEWNTFEKEHLYEIRSISGGILMQTCDKADREWGPTWICHGTAPDAEKKQELLFAWKVCTALKSNSIALTSERQTVGLGMGQVNRVDAVDHAIGRWKKNHPDKNDVVMASDAFFPFADSVAAAAKAGIRWIIQPGGSIKDEEVLMAAHHHGVNMILTHKRHFRH